MPTINERIILRAWWYDNQPGKLHFIAAQPDGSERRLWMDEGNVLYPLVRAHLDAIGYEGPKPGDRDAEEDADMAP